MTPMICMILIGKPGGDGVAISCVALARNSAIAADRLRKRLKDWRTE
ncbi:hypothetical protein [Rhizobium mulingense]|uniref:Uncharacterized protein n=2 Tax=Rhizobium mulingense TaxID=3031128 RepID=A0ACC6N3Y4_9HYPH|nr:hypothetical protein [Rhizobium sp. MJ31]MEA3520088.1 hypothetical protein [Rhizobium sp. MJ31]